MFETNTVPTSSSVQWSKKNWR